MAAHDNTHHPLLVRDEQDHRDVVLETKKGQQKTGGTSSGVDRSTVSTFYVREVCSTHHEGLINWLVHPCAAVKSQMTSFTHLDYGSALDEVETVVILQVIGWLTVIMSSSACFITNIYLLVTGNIYPPTTKKTTKSSPRV